MPAHPGPNARRADYTVVKLDKALYPTARRFIEEGHYTGSVANTAVHVFGLLKAGHLVGVAWWKTPGTQRAAAYTAGLYADRENWKQVLDLSRLAVDNDEPRNATSLFLGACIRFIRKEGRWRYLVAFADEGEGHEGTIYKATGWTFSGYSEARDRWKDAAGRHVAMKATKSRTRQQMKDLGYVPTGKTRKIRFTRRLW